MASMVSVDDDETGTTPSRAAAASRLVLTADQPVLVKSNVGRYRPRGRCLRDLRREDSRGEATVLCAERVAKRPSWTTPASSSWNDQMP